MRPQRLRLDLVPGSSRSRWLTTTALTVALLSLGACKESDDESSKAGGATKPAEQGSAEGTSPPPRPSERTRYEPHRPLLSESARAELDAGGVLIDFGTADQHKYTRGGWRTGWGTSSKQGTSLVQIDSRKADLAVHVSEAPVAEVVVRARSKTPNQVLTINVDGGRIGDGTLAAEWTTIRIPAKGLEPGRHDLDIIFSAGGSPRAEIDWMWLSREAGAPEPLVVPRVIPVRIGERPKRSLVAPTERAYAFYLQVPDGAKLITDVGSDKGARFEVVAEVDGEEPKELWSGEGTDTWQEVVVDLSPIAGKAARLSLVTSGAEGVAGWGEPEIMVPPAKGEQPPGGKAKNAIVILIDTVRADSFAPFAPKNEVVTPTFDALAEKSTVFVNAYNQENWTKPSVATTLSGTYPSTHDTKKDGSRLPDEVELISQRLQGEGYATAGFVANGYVSGKFGFEKGWDAFKNYIRLSKPSEAEHVYGDALAWLDEHQDEKFFLYIQTIDPHVVYRVEREFTKHYFDGDYSGPLGSTIMAEEQIALGKGKIKATERDLQWLKALYWGETSYHDHHMGLFFEELEKRGILDSTVVVITNDHGEELGDHGKYGHGHSLFEELLRAPLMFHFPKVFAAETRQEVVENVDVAQTVLDVLGEKPLEKADGMSLLPLIHGEAVQRPFYALSEFLESRRAARVGSYKMIISAGDYVALYNVDEDPGEEKDLDDERPIARRMVEVYMGEGLATPDKAQRLEDITTVRQFTAGQADIDPELRKQLEALGYFGE